MSKKQLRLIMLGLAAALLIACGAALLVLVGSQPQSQRMAEAPPAAAPATPSLPTPPAAPQTTVAAPAAPAAPAPAAPAPASDASAPTAIAPSGAPAEIVAARAEVERRIAEAPEIARFFDRLRLALPGEYETAIGVLARRRIGGGDDTPDYYLSEAVKTLRQSRGALAAKADGPALSKVFAQQVAVLNALSQRDARACVDFLYGGASDAFFKFSADNRALVSDLATAGLEAIVDGKQKNIARPAPNEADFQMFEAALKKAGLSQPEIDALLDGKTPDPPLPDARMCAAGRTYLQTLAGLPDPTRLRIYSLAIDLMARS